MMETIIEIKKVCYEHDLPENSCTECGDDSIVTHLIVNEERILSGDEYHDKISDQIKGFLFALNHFRIDFNIKKNNDMELNEIKKALYKEKPMAKQTAIYRDGGSTDYEAVTSLGVVKFHVPIQDKWNGDGDILSEFKQKEIPAQLLIRWIRS